VSIDMDVVGVMAAYLPVVPMCAALSREALFVSTNYIFVHLFG